MRELSSAVVVWLACSLGLCGGCDRTSDRISSEKARHLRNPQYSCICYFFHLWNPDAETQDLASARSRIFYDPSAYLSGYGCVVIVCLMLYKQAKKRINYYKELCTE